MFMPALKKNCPVTWSLIKQRCRWNSKKMSPSCENFETLSKFLVIFGICRRFLRYKACYVIALRKMKSKMNPVFEIVKPSPLPINIFYAHVYSCLSIKLLASGVQWFVAPELDINCGRRGNPRLQPLQTWRFE